MLKFTAQLDGKKVRTFSAASMETIYGQFNRYCKNRGFDRRVETSESFGFVAWSNGSQSINLVRVGGAQ